MKILNILFCLLLFTVSVNAQKKEPLQEKIKTVDSTTVLTIDKTIKTLYNVISGEIGKERNWEQFKYLFSPNAKLIAAGKDGKGANKTTYMSPDDYIKNSNKWLVTNGFFEKEIHRKSENFGNMAHIFSTYECFYNISEKKPFMRGINSIQLWNDGKRWWILNVYWTQETKENGIPDMYLTK